MLKIWGRRNSINVQKVMWCVAELAIAHDRVDAGGAFGGLDDPAYVAMNPNRLVPCIDDDGFRLWESHAIVRYLAAKYGAGTLAPADPRIHAHADQWMDWVATTIVPSLRVVFWGLVRTPEADRDMAAIEKAVAEQATLWTLLDFHLAERAYVTGDRFTLGDIPVGCAAYRWLALDISRPELGHVQRWYERLTRRPAFADNVMIPLS